MTARTATRDERRSSSNRRRELLGCCGVAVLVAAAATGAPAAAATAAGTAAASSSPTNVEELVVTANKREQNIQLVPMSVVAVTGREIEQRSFQDLQDVVRGVPGLTFETERPGETRFALRGIPNFGGSGATVSLYVDETPIMTDESTRTFATDPGAFDLERVEVLRGPQGTLYGASSMGGTIRLITVKPNLTTFQAEADARTSDTDHGGWNYGGTVIVNAPIIEDRVAIRLGVKYDNYDGFIDRIPVPSLFTIPGIAADFPRLKAGQKGINKVETINYKASVLAKVTNDFELTATVFGTRNRYANQSAVDASFNGQLVNTNVINEPSLDQNTVFNVTGNYDLHFANLVSSSSFDLRKFRSTTDLTRFIADIFGDALESPFAATSKIQIFTQELRLVSSGDHIVDYVVGGFYTRLRELAGANLVVPGTSAELGFPIQGDNLFLKYATKNTDEWAGFGELTLNPTPKLHLKAGVRVFQGRQAFEDDDSGLFNGGATRQRASSDYSGVNPKAEVSYNLTSNDLLYATASRGYRPGGADFAVPVPICSADLATLGLTAPPTGFRPDHLWNYEAGAKTAWLDGRLIANGAVYLIKWTDIQLNEQLPTCGFAFQTNGGSATSKGFEFETRASIARGLSVDVGTGYAHARLDQASPGIPFSHPGSPIPGVPDWTANAAVTYEHRLTDNLEGTVTASYQYSAAFREDLGPPSALNRRDSVSNVNLTAEISNGHWKVGLFADNLFNNFAVVGENSMGPFVQWTVNRPRTVGVELGVKY